MDKEDKWINININININIDGEDNRTIGFNCLGRRIPGARGGLQVLGWPLLIRRSLYRFRPISLIVGSF